MNKSVLFCVAIIVFVLLFQQIVIVLRNLPLFKGANTVVIAACVALLSTIGIFTADAFKNPAGNMIGFILAAYAAMAIAILCVLLIRKLSKFKVHIIFGRKEKNEIKQFYKNKRSDM